MKTFTKHAVIFCVLGLFLAPLHVIGAESSGDIFGDLIHIKRDITTGQPILQKRWIEYPGDVFDWGYCPIPVDLEGEEIPFVDLTCDPVDTEAVVEVDYFGRLSAGRTAERVIRMHFDEVISKIKEAEKTKFDAAGRLMLGTECYINKNGYKVCSTWQTIDSPMENMALYVRLMKYGHFQTDPMEEDIWAAGDPAAGVQYHPALGLEDWPKLWKAFRPENSWENPNYCFNANGSFNTECSLPESLSNVDFVLSAMFLGAAADKTGKATIDLVQYMNRIFKIPKATETTLANIDLLPALIRDCGPDPDNPLPYEECEIIPAMDDMVAPANEKFVDFSPTAYSRDKWFDKSLDVLEPIDGGYWLERQDVRLLDWLEFANGPSPEGNTRNIQGLVNAMTDSMRTIQFIHNYEIPADLGWDFE